MNDPVNHPKHYTSHPSGIETIVITEHLGFCLGNAYKYLLRGPYKGEEVQDLKKAKWYVERELSLRHTEVWCEYPVDTRYEVSTLGNVRKKGRPNRVLVKLKSGYTTFLTVNNGKAVCHYVHRAVAKTFLGDAPKGMHVCHVNGNRADNRVGNLRISTVQENYEDRRFHGTDNYGERGARAKLTRGEVEEIRELQQYISAKEAAKAYGVTKSTIQRIWGGVTWRKSVPDIVSLIEYVSDADPRENISPALLLVACAKWSKTAAEDLHKVIEYIDREIARLEKMEEVRLCDLPPNDDLRRFFKP